jgi:drug/metabolite transporter (DMT)-like permease
MQSSRPTAQRDTRAVRAELGLLVLVAIWAVNFSVLKVGLAAFEPYAFNALRFVLAAVFLTVALQLRGGIPLPDREDVARVVGLGLLGHVIYQLLFINGMDLTRAGNAALMLGTAPVYTALFSRLAGHERVGPVAGAGMVATMAGVALVIGSGGGPLSFSSSTVLGDLLVMGAAILWAAYTVGARKIVRKYGALTLMVWTLWVGSVCLVVIGAPQLLAMEPASPGAWAAVAYCGILGIGVAQLLWYRGVKLIGSTRTAVYQNVVPIGAIAVAWAWLDEVPNAGQLLGAAVVVGGVAVVRRSMRAA